MLGFGDIGVPFKSMFSGEIGKSYVCSSALDALALVNSIQTTLALNQKRPTSLTLLQNRKKQLFGCALDMPLGLRFRRSGGSLVQARRRPGLPRGLCASRLVRYFSRMTKMTTLMSILLPFKEPNCGHILILLQMGRPKGGSDQEIV